MQSEPTFQPFFDPLRGGRVLTAWQKGLISLAPGLSFALLHYATLSDRSLFFEQYGWLLALLISVSACALYAAVAILRQSLLTIRRLSDGESMTERLRSEWLGDGYLLLSGILIAIANVALVNLFGAPPALLAGPLAAAVLYAGYALVGFVAGVALWVTLAIIVLYLRFAVSLRHTLNPEDETELGDFARLAEGLWRFALLVASVGVLISIYLLNVDWTSLHRELSQTLFLIWLALPYLLAITVVMVPGMALRRQLGEIKAFRAEQLRLEKAQLLASYKRFEDAADDEIISRKREIKARLNQTQRQIDKLSQLRLSRMHLPGDH